MRNQYAAIRGFYEESVSKVGRPEAVLWTWLTLNADRDLRLSVSLRSIGDALNWSESSVERVINLLVRSGLVVRHPRRLIGEVNSYTLIPVVAADSADTDG